VFIDEVKSYPFDNGADICISCSIVNSKKLSDDDCGCSRYSILDKSTQECECVEGYTAVYDQNGRADSCFPCDELEGTLHSSPSLCGCADNAKPGIKP